MSRFLVGCNPNIKPGIIAFYDSFIYVCGNNIVITNPIDMTQSFIPAIDGSQGISTFELSPCKKYLAVCEKAPQAICVVYELKTLKQKRVLTSSEIGASEFVGLSFARSEKDKLQQYLCTLTNRCADGQFRLVVWLWEKSRLVTS